MQYLKIVHFTAFRKWFPATWAAFLEKKILPAHWNYGNYNKKKKKTCVHQTFCLHLKTLLQRKCPYKSIDSISVWLCVSHFSSSLFEQVGMYESLKVNTHIKKRVSRWRRRPSAVFICSPEREKKPGAKPVKAHHDGKRVFLHLCFGCTVNFCSSIGESGLVTLINHIARCEKSQRDNIYYIGSCICVFFFRLTLLSRSGCFWFDRMVGTPMRGCWLCELCMTLLLELCAN